MVDAVVSIFLDKLIDTLMKEGQNIVEFRDQFEEMKKQLKLMRGFLKDADRMRRTNHSLQAVTDDLIELIYDAEDILAYCEARYIGQKDFTGNCLFCFSPTDISFLSRTGKQLRQMNKKIKEIKENMTSYLSPALVIHQRTEDSDSNSKRWSSPIFDPSQIVGLQNETNEIKGWLFEAGDDLKAIGIVGMGGLGKTTTTKKVFCDSEVENKFEKRMWISVSQNFTEKEIMRNMLKNLGDVSIGDDEGELLKKIYHYLLGKSYLLVLDDVWSLRSGWWTRLNEGLPKGNGSRVIVTTRSELIAKQMGVADKRLHRPKCLTVEESWSLFSRIVFAGICESDLDPKLNEVGIEIVGKCGGLPLAIKAVGGMMFCKPASFIEWRRIADNFRDELEQNSNSVMASLQLSYDELPSHLKSCFLCFSIYPEDCIILKDQLIHWWIAEGFVTAKIGRSLIESGEAIFMGLMNRCLIEAVDKSFTGKVHTCKMHDMVRELVIKLGGEEAFCKSNNNCFRRLSLTSGIDEKHLKSNPKLRALVSTTNARRVNKVRSAVAENFSKSENLRVLDLSESIFETHLKDLLSKIGSLQHLRYINLRNTHPMNEVPYAVKNLTNLQIIDLSFCHNIKALPPYIESLENLVVLDTSCCGSLKYIPKGIGKLSSLEVLKGFRPARESYTDGCRFAELKSLTRLRKLELQICRGDEITTSELDILLELKNLQDLTISCYASYGDDLMRKLGLLSLPLQLHELCLKFFPGELTPAWLNPVLLPHLQYLSISHGNFSHLDSRFWGDKDHFWRLQGLMLESLPDLEEEWWRLQRSMPLLEILNVSWCPRLETFPVDDVGFNGGVWRKKEYGR
ncbi:Disease resistance RPP13-like protein 4 [Cocos nucifera]|nr:Disease resistance RPP13-like protein 4 [Cocos nucifera]